MFLLRPCLGQGASRRAWVGRVRSLAFLSLLRECFLLATSSSLWVIDFSRVYIVFPQPVRYKYGIG